MRYLIGSIMLSFCIISFAGEQSSMRCGNGFIEKGMNFNQVKKECGRKWKPANIERFTQQTADPTLRYSDGTMPVNTNLIEKWTYAVYGRFITHVTFKNGRVVRIFETSTRK